VSNKALTQIAVSSGYEPALWRLRFFLGLMLIGLRKIIAIIDSDLRLLLL
jgi:hypothetical protein